MGFFSNPYVRIARVDHWFKNIFMLPGLLVALLIDPSTVNADTLVRFVFAVFITGLIASSNYVINEVLDAEKDKVHPVKRNRPVPAGLVNIRMAYVEWAILGSTGLVLASLLGRYFFLCAAALLVMGIVYNIPPIRSKEKPYLDVLSESINNPLRMLLGWYATTTVLFPPTSLLLAYWMIGAFFMAVKRFAEYRHIGDPAAAARYRHSFSYYDEQRLLVSIIYYASAFGLFFGIFLIRYRIELILSIPLIAGVIAWYLKIGFQADSPAQYPEKLYRESGLVILLAVTFVIMLALLFIDVDMLNQMFEKTRA